MFNKKMLLFFYCLLIFINCSIKCKNLQESGILALNTQEPNNWYVMLAKHSSGIDKGKWDAFFSNFEDIPKNSSNNKDNDNNINSPIEVAAKGFGKETFDLVIANNKLIKYIDPESGKTKWVVINKKNKSILYITDFDQKDLSKFESQYPQARQEYKFGLNTLKKDSIGWVRWDNLIKAVTSAKFDKNGNLLIPVKIWANIIHNITGKRLGQEIELRPFLVKALYQFFDYTNKNGDYKQCLFNPNT